MSSYSLIPARNAAPEAQRASRIHRTSISSPFARSLFGGRPAERELNKAEHAEGELPLDPRFRRVIAEREVQAEKEVGGREDKPANIYGNALKGAKRKANPGTVRNVQGSA